MATLETRWRVIFRKGSFSSVRFFDSASYENAWDMAAEYAATAEGFGPGWYAADITEDR